MDDGKKFLICIFGCMLVARLGSGHSNNGFVLNTIPKRDFTITSYGVPFMRLCLRIWLTVFQFSKSCTCQQAYVTVVYLPCMIHMTWYDLRSIVNVKRQRSRDVAHFLNHDFHHHCLGLNRKPQTRTSHRSVPRSSTPAHFLVSSVEAGDETLG